MLQPSEKMIERVWSEMRKLDDYYIVNQASQALGIGYGSVVPRCAPGLSVAGTSHEKTLESETHRPAAA